jgi:hypothetical protein
MPTLSNRTCVSQILFAAALLGLTGCGSGTQTASSGNFSGAVAPGGNAAASITLSSAQVIAGDSTEVTVSLAQPAPEGGADLQLTTSDASALAIPATMRIPAGQTSATISATTSPASSATTVSITALFADSLTSTALAIVPAAPSQFTVALQPSSVTIAPGHSGSSNVTTKVSAGYKHALTLTAANLPAGVSVTFTPSVIPSPGAGTSKAVIAVQSSVKVGTYSFRVTASDGTASQNTSLTLKLAVKDPGAKFHGCWYHSSGHRYQGVDISVANAGKYPFDAVLYRGATCDPSNQADEFGFGTPLNFGGFDWIFWFADFGDQADTSALWHVGRDTSQCVSYATAPDC